MVKLVKFYKMYSRYRFKNELEEWKLIPNSKGYYISNFGNIKRCTRKVWNPNNNGWSTIKEHKIIPSTNNSKGYVRVRVVYKDGKQKTESIHRLVALAFVINPNVNKFNQVNHLDGNILNNHWKNLQWCTNQMNMTHSWKYLKRRKTGREASLRTKTRKLEEVDVLSIPELLKTMTITEIAKKFNVKISTITEITHHRSWKYLNLKFN